MRFPRYRAAREAAAGRKLDFNGLKHGVGRRIGSDLRADRQHLVAVEIKMVRDEIPRLSPHDEADDQGVDNIEKECRHQRQDDEGRGSRAMQLCYRRHVGD